MSVGIRVRVLQSAYRDKSIGAVVAQSLATKIGCDNSRAAHGDPQSPYKPNLPQDSDEKKTEE